MRSAAVKILACFILLSFSLCFVDKDKDKAVKPPIKKKSNPFKDMLTKRFYVPNFGPQGEILPDTDSNSPANVPVKSNSTHPAKLPNKEAFPTK